MPTEENRPPRDLGPVDADRSDAMLDGQEPPPPGVALMAIVRWLILGAAASLAIVMWWSYASAELHGAASASEPPSFHCPMHPQIVSNEPGECPICHMSLEPFVPPPKAAPSASAATTPAPKRPAKPTPARGAPGHPASSASPARAPAPGGAPPGTVPITLTLARIQAIGVRTTLVGEGSEAQTLRATAVVAPTEQGVAEVHVRSAGFVERVFVGQTQVAVSAGQPLFTYYSPEIFQAESELLALHDWRGPSDAANTMTGAAPADSARRKLELLGMSSRDIDQVVETRTPLRAVTISAPRAGYVMQKGLVAGSYLTPEMKLYEIQDLSQVYVVADVFQGDIGYLQKGTAGKFAPARRPEPSIDVKVDLVYPTLHAEARTTRVRMQVKSTKELLLRPGEFGTVEFATPAPKALTVPRDAVIDTGLATYVFVVQGEGVFSPREVVVRADHGDEVSVEAGLSSGERVVSGATFLIDSESRLQASAVEALAPAPSQSP